MVTMVSLPCRSRRAKTLWINDVEEFELFSGWVWTCLESIVVWVVHPTGFSWLKLTVLSYRWRSKTSYDVGFFGANILAALLKGACLCRNRSKSWCSQFGYFGSGSIFVLRVLYCSIFTCQKMLAWRRWDMKHMIFIDFLWHSARMVVCF